jgi:outer membrane protein TolC
LSKEQAAHQAIVAIYKKRVTLGAASNVELSTANLQLQANAAMLHQAQQQSQTLYNQLASQAGLPLTQFNKLILKSDLGLQSNQDWPLAELQKNALLNRLDLRIALLRYASMESKLKLEIANQYPDLVISPGYAYEFGDSVWSLGLSGLLNLLHKNKLAIAEASQLREVEAAQFEVLQSQIMADTAVAHAKLSEARTALTKQKSLLNEQQLQEKRMASLLAAGQIDRLAYTLAKLETVLAEKNLATAQHQYNDAIRILENTLEQPLSSAGVKYES